MRRWKIERLPITLRLALPHILEVFNDVNHPLFKSLHLEYCKQYGLDADIALQQFIRGKRLTYLLNISTEGRCMETKEVIDTYLQSGIVSYFPITNRLIDSIDLLNLISGE